MAPKPQASPLDSAIAALEAGTNPSLLRNRPTCNCNAQEHELLAAAPNCLSCGKIICIREGYGPCTFCGTPLLSSSEIQAMLTELKAERGRERMEAHKTGQKKADVSRNSRPFRDHAGTSLLDTQTKAMAHRDKLLGYQATSAQRMRVHDEAADFETPEIGASIWASPMERAKQVKRQMKQMRDMEWEAKEEWEKRRVVASLDLSGGKVVKRMERIQRPNHEDESVIGIDREKEYDALSKGEGAFSRNPLIGSLVRPMYDAQGKGKGKEGSSRQVGQKTWRRVQDDLDDNEEVILDGGVYGAR
jgi:hypothetical protein